MKVQPFQINVPQETLDDIQERLARTRWPNEITGSDWTLGTNLAYLKELVTYWQNDFDWRKQEALLNTFPQFKTEIDRVGIHFVHVKGKGPNPTPLLLIHGWPDSFYRFYKIIPMLVDPEKYGGKAEDSFDVIVPSIPGYGFSDRPTERGFTAERVAGLFANLMSTLGYEKYVAHGGDWGAGITEELGLHHGDSLLGIHLTEVPYQHMFALQGVELSETEQKFLEATNSWVQTEGAYANIQATKPQTPAYALNDSPVGLAAWMVEKFYIWSDCGGEIERCYSKDELLTNIMIYWTTQTIGSSFQLYWDSGSASGDWSGVAKQRVLRAIGQAVPQSALKCQQDLLFFQKTSRLRHVITLSGSSMFSSLQKCPRVDTLQRWKNQNC